MLRNRIFLSLLMTLVILSCAQKEQVTSRESTAVSSTVASTSATSSPPPAVASTGAAPAAAPVPVAAAAVTDTGIASADGEQSGVTVVVKELKRASGGIVSLKLTVINNSDKKVGFGYHFADPDHEGKDISTIGGAQLIDPVGKKKYFVARDGDDRCVCSQRIGDIEPGKSTNLWAKFPAPPEDVQKISVVIPHFAPLDDVPISR